MSEDRKPHAGVPVLRVTAAMPGWTAACWAVLGALFAPVVAGGWLTVLRAALLTAAPVVVLARGFALRAYPSAAVRLWVLRPFWYVQLGLPLLLLAAGVGAATDLAVDAPVEGGRVAVLMTAGLLFLLGTWGYIGSRRLRVESVLARFSSLSAGLEGLRIAQLSDLHVGPHTPRRHLARIARAVAAVRPDLIAITGDQVDDYAADLAHFARAFAGLAAPLGVFAVPGRRVRALHLAGGELLGAAAENRGAPGGYGGDDRRFAQPLTGLRILAPPLAGLRIFARLRLAYWLGP